MFLKRQAQAGLQQAVLTATLPTTGGGETQQTQEVLPDGSVKTDEVWAATITNLPVVGAAVAGTTITSAGALWVEVKYLPLAASAGWTPIVRLSRVA